MAIYVDPLRPCVAVKHWPWSESCHLFADEYKDLHRAAGRLGLSHRWFQDRPVPHYDLSPSKRREAVQTGAVELTVEDTLALVEKQRKPIHEGPGRRQPRRRAGAVVR